ncbi:hypothetical protein [Methylobacterium aquaticum]|uniref:Uncharacterized protein n=1 Tax=Methylobacterium aquaticum TaxID=270351 RepID=A0A0C6FPX7_9HYPH|nr:hypothetical protein [Methylobacterium aquaticum]BAQ50343.1 hypothetical protein Maq22A_3p50470 [Methylobacterium aquaticum]
MSKITAKVIPFSSVTGSGITLHDETGAVIGMMPLRGFGADLPAGLEAFKVGCVAVCERIAAAINAGQPERQVRHLKRDQVYDVVAGEALFQTSVQSALGKAGPGKMRLLRDGDPLTVYRNNELGMTFVRVPEEVEDDTRFEQLEA